LSKSETVEHFSGEAPQENVDHAVTSSPIERNNHDLSLSRRSASKVVTALLAFSVVGMVSDLSRSDRPVTALSLSNQNVPQNITTFDDAAVNALEKAVADKKLSMAKAEKLKKIIIPEDIKRPVRLQNPDKSVVRSVLLEEQAEDAAPAEEAQPFVTKPAKEISVAKFVDNELVLTGSEKMAATPVLTTDTFVVNEEEVVPTRPAPSEPESLDQADIELTADTEQIADEANVSEAVSAEEETEEVTSEEEIEEVTSEETTGFETETSEDTSPAETDEASAEVSESADEADEETETTADSTAADAVNQMPIVALTEQTKPATTSGAQEIIDKLPLLALTGQTKPAVTSVMLEDEETPIPAQAVKALETLSALSNTEEESFESFLQEIAENAAAINAAAAAEAAEVAPDGEETKASASLGIDIEAASEAKMKSEQLDAEIAELISVAAKEAALKAEEAEMSKYAVECSDADRELFYGIMASECGARWDYEGCLMIAQTVTNRVRNTGGTLRGVLTAPGQFTTYSSGMWRTRSATPAQKQAADDALKGKRIIDDDVVYFCTNASYRRSRWFQSLDHRGTYDNTEFFATW
jgi:spore germination cell wall hydrolase CwlJ-like protein